jgi:hypothetical protein
MINTSKAKKKSLKLNEDSSKVFSSINGSKANGEYLRGFNGKVIIST